jgi:NAD-dependent deacetylase
MDDVYKAIAADILKSQHVVAFTGAGISSESGISTYRGAGGLWNKYDPNRYANIHYFKQDPSYYWSFFRDVRYPMLNNVVPNKAHLALAEMEQMGHMQTMITQNIDGLHQEAGSTSVIELHGTTQIISCMNCAEEYPMEVVFPILDKEIPPLCQECRGILSAGLMKRRTVAIFSLLWEVLSLSIQPLIFLLLPSKEERDWSSSIKIPPPWINLQIM